jgi:hypothetical protein
MRIESRQLSSFKHYCQSPRQGQWAQGASEVPLTIDERSVSGAYARLAEVCLDLLEAFRLLGNLIFTIIQLVRTGELRIREMADSEAR